MSSKLHIIPEFFRTLHPVKMVTLGYAFYITAIFALLCLPWCQGSLSLSWLDHLFMATSSVSTTGLVTENTPFAYSIWGQLVLFIGFQIGGLGYMTLGSFFILASKRRLSESRLKIGHAVFAMPETFQMKSFIKHAVIYTGLCELIGGALLYHFFKQENVEGALWAAIFHAVSAFCTAGFSVFPNSLIDFSTHPGVNVVITLLSVLGATGFIVVTDGVLAFREKNHRITLTTKIILYATMAGLFFGTVCMFFDPGISTLPVGDRLQVAIFQAMTAMTTVGFNSYPIEDLSFAAVSIMMLLMILGASPSGTGGGLKSTSWTAGLAAAWSAIKGRQNTTFWGQEVPFYRIQAAFASLTLYMVFFVSGSAIVLALEQHAFEDSVFEVASALGTVGLSRGITGDLTTGSTLVLIALMYIGRVGVLSLGLAALSSSKEKPEMVPVVKNDIVI